MKFVYNSKLVKIFLPKKYDAITISKNTCLVRNSRLSLRMQRHETVHGKQFEREGWFKFVFNYICENMRVGYWDNKYEVEARRAE